jgi:hypothetical protein
MTVAPRCASDAATAAGGRLGAPRPRLFPARRSKGALGFNSLSRQLRATEVRRYTLCEVQAWFRDMESSSVRALGGGGGVFAADGCRLS